MFSVAEQNDLSDETNTMFLLHKELFHFFSHTGEGGAEELLQGGRGTKNIFARVPTKTRLEFLEKVRLKLEKKN